MSPHTVVAAYDQLPEALTRLPHDAPGTRFAYLLPNFQNPPAG